MLTTKQTDLAISYLPLTLRTISQGAQFTIIGKLIQAPLDSILVLSDGPISELKDLSGCRVGIADSCYSALLLDRFVANAHLHNVEKKIVNFDVTAALFMKHVDAIYGAYWNIETEQMRLLGKEVRYFPVTSFGIPDYEELVIVGRKDTPHVDGEFISRFQRALQKSITSSHDNPKEAFELYLKSNPDKGERSQLWEENAWEKTVPLLPSSQEFDEVKMQKLIDWLVENKIMLYGVEPSLVFGKERGEKVSYTSSSTSSIP